MLLTNETVTLVQEIREDSGERYCCTVIRGVSWHGKAVTNWSTNGAQSQNLYSVRIPEENLPLEVVPRKGDYLVRGEVHEVRRAPADFAEQEYLRVSAVGDNRRGKLRHWAVRGA